MLIADTKDKPLIVAILTKAFLDNKSVNYLVPQDGLKIYRIHQLMDYSFEICLRFGKVILSEDKKACALLLYPELKKATLAAILLDLKLIFRGIGLGNVRRAIKRENKIKAIQPKEPKVYLWFIGVDPKYQKFGLGKKLMLEVIDFCWKDKRPIYLETSTLENLPFYEKQGFECVFREYYPCQYVPSCSVGNMDL